MCAAYDACVHFEIIENASVLKVYEPEPAATRSRLAEERIQRTPKLLQELATLYLPLAQELEHQIPLLLP